MTKPKRIAIPKSTKDPVLKEFNHRCSICGGDRPQVHHIDENPSNNDPLNLLPLCPNCHLRDQHDPTRTLEVDRLRLFRAKRDPLILQERFEPLWHRSKWLLNVDQYTLDQLSTKAEELASFVEALAMGAFYAKQLRSLLEVPAMGRAPFTDTPSHIHEKWNREDTATYRAVLAENREVAFGLIVELLRYQQWAPR
jgi:hypothetical protein